MTPDAEKALVFVAEFNGDARCSLNCHYAEALAAEVRRLVANEAEFARWLDDQPWDRTTDAARRKLRVLREGR